MTDFYKYLKIVCIYVECFLLIALVPAIIYNIANPNWVNVAVSVVAIVLMNAVIFFLMRYYRNVVIDISFSGDNAVIRTNGKEYVLPSANFTEINNSESFGRTFITYADGHGEKRFVFQKKYSLSKSYSLNIEEMKAHMTAAVYKET